MTPSGMRPLQVVTSTLALAAVALLAAGCASGPASPAPTSSGSGGATESTSPPPSDDFGPMPDDIEAAWVDGGRSFAVVTWGSSGTDCQPATAEATADGQTVTVVLSDPETDGDVACTSDLGPRAILVETPEGVDITKDVELNVTYGTIRDDAELDALSAPMPIDTDYQPTAGWFDDDGIVLLTWGSSTCRPQVQDVAQTDAGATVTFAEIDGACSQDMAPRLTVLSLQTEHDDDAPFALTLKGGGLDGTVDVLGRG